MAPTHDARTKEIPPRTPEVAWQTLKWNTVIDALPLFAVVASVPIDQPDGVIIPAKPDGGDGLAIPAQLQRAMRTRFKRARLA